MTMDTSRKLSYSILDSDIVISGKGDDLRKDDYFNKEDVLWDIVIDVNGIDSLVEQNMRFIAMSCVTITDLTLKISASTGERAFANGMDALFGNAMSRLYSLSVDLGFNDTEGVIVKKIRPLPTLRILRVNIRGGIYYRAEDKNQWKLDLDGLESYEIYNDTLSLVREKSFFSTWSMRNLKTFIVRNVVLTDDIIPFVKRNGFSIQSLELSTHHFRFQDFLDSSPYLESLTLDARFATPATLTHARLNTCCFRSVDLVVRSSGIEWGKALSIMASFVEKSRFPLMRTLRILDANIRTLVVDKLYKKRCREFITVCEGKGVKVLDNNGDEITSNYFRGPAISKIEGMGSFSLRR